MGGQRHSLTTLTPGGRDSNRILQVVWAPGPVSIAAENIASTGSVLGAVRSVGSRYIDWAIPYHTLKSRSNKVRYKDRTLFWGITQDPMDEKW